MLRKGDRRASLLHVANKQSPSVTLALHVKGWNEVTKRAGLGTDGAQAAALNISRPHVNQVRNGRCVPGPEFIAAALRAFPDAAFEELFMVVAKDAA